MELKALIYQQKEGTLKQLSTKLPSFPVETISEKSLAAWKLHPEEVLLLTPTDAGIQEAIRQQIAVAAYVDPSFPGQSYTGAWMVIEGFEEVDDLFLERIFQRCHGLPWEIARTRRCVIRELSLKDLPALERLYQKEGVTWRRGADGERMPGFIEPLFSREKEKEYQQAYISNMYGYYGYGMWLVFDKTSGKLIGRAGLEHRDFLDAVELDMGYLIDPGWQGQGLATEVCQAILAFAREQLDFSRVNVLTDSENTASVELLRKLGFYYLEDTDVSGSRTQRYIYEFS